MKKRIICFALMLVMVLSLCSCVMHQKYDYDMTEYIQIPTIAGKEIEVELDQVQSTIDADIISASLSNKYTSQEGDNVDLVVTFTELVYKDAENKMDQYGNVIFSSDDSSTDGVKETINIPNLGSGFFHPEIEKKFLKKKIGQEQEEQYTLPTDLSAIEANFPQAYNVLKEYAGKLVYLKYTFVSRPVVEGDIVSVTFTGYHIDENGNIKIGDDGKEVTFDGGSGTSNVYIGARTFIEDFEKGLVGFSVGKEGQIKATFPDDYHADELKGKTVIFKATVKDIYQAETYDLDFIKDTYGEYESIEAFEKELTKTYAAQQLVDFLVSNSVVLDYPKKEYKLLKGQLEEMELSFLSQYGIEFDTYLKNYLGFDSREAYIKYTMQAEMAYFAYAQANNIMPTESDIANARLSLIAEYTQQYMNSNDKLTEAEATEYATSFVDEEMTEAEIHQEALYSVVGDHLLTQYVLKEIPATYTSVSKGGSLFN